MDVEYADCDLEKLEIDPAHGAGRQQAVVKAFRKRMQIIRAANDERDLYALKGNGFEKLKGKRKHQHSLMLTGNWRLIIELIEIEPKKKKVKVIEIVDYH